MLEKFKEQRIRIAIIVIAAVLIFYAVGNATNLFGNPVFSMFWVLSNEQAHSVAIYGAVAGVVAVLAIGLAMTLIKKRKTLKPGTTYKPAISSFKPATSSIKTPIQTPVKAAPPTISHPTITPKMNSKKEEYKTEQKIEPIKQPIIQPTIPSAAQKPVTPINIPTNGQNKTNNQKINTDKPTSDKLSCPNCKKQFGTPLFMLEYVQSKPKLVGHCPYCDQTLVNVQKDA